MPNVSDFVVMAVQADVLLCFCGMPSVIGWILDKIGM